MEFNYKKIIQSFRDGIAMLSSAMRKLTACDDINFENFKQQNLSKKPIQKFFDIHEHDYDDALTKDIRDNIDDRVRSALGSGYSELNAFIVSPDKSSTLNTAFRETKITLSNIPDEVDMAHSETPVDYKAIKSYAGLCIMKHNDTLSDASIELASKINNKTTELSQAKEMKA